MFRVSLGLWLTSWGLIPGGLSDPPRPCTHTPLYILVSPCASALWSPGGFNADISYLMFVSPAAQSRVRGHLAAQCSADTLSACRRPT